MGELGAAFLLFSIIGYVLLRHVSVRFKLRWDALNWEQNVFESAVAGLVSFLGARGIVLVGWAAVRWLDHWVLTTPLWFLARWTGDFRLMSTLALKIEAVIAQLAPVKYSGSFGIALGLVWFGGKWHNRKVSKQQAAELAVKIYGNEMIAFLHEAAATNVAVYLTLSNRKVYVGWVTAPPWVGSSPSVRILPTLSGHRTTDSLEVVFTTGYREVYEDLEKNLKPLDFAAALRGYHVVVPVSDIAVASVFNEELYVKYFLAKQDPGEETEAGDGAQEAASTPEGLPGTEVVYGIAEPTSPEIPQPSNAGSDTRVEAVPAPEPENRSLRIAADASGGRSVGNSDGKPIPLPPASSGENPQRG